MIFKVDFQKAYYYLSWDYLLDIMKITRFAMVWCGWNMDLLRSTTTSIFVNGSLIDEF